MFGFLAAMAMLLAALGLYGVISQSVAQRTREIGIRMALGANPSDIRGWVMREVGVICGCGLTAGVGLALALRQVVGALAWGVSATDPLTYGLVAVLMGAVAVAAAWAPARRALRVAPTTALRVE